MAQHPTAFFFAALAAGSFGKGISLVVRKYVVGNLIVVSVNGASKADGKTSIESKVPGVGVYTGTKVSLI